MQRGGHAEGTRSGAALTLPLLVAAVESAITQLIMCTLASLLAMIAPPCAVPLLVATSLAPRITQPIIRTDAAFTAQSAPPSTLPLTVECVADPRMSSRLISIKWPPST
jgi:hypothetical protein